MNSNHATALQAAQEKAKAIAGSPAFAEFVERIRAKFPWRFQNIPPDTLDRDYLRVVDHHLRHLLSRVQRYVEPTTRRVLDFGCGSGGSAIALAMVYPELHCYGTDVDADEIAVARERAKLYQVDDRCEFYHLREGESLPFANGFFETIKGC